MPLLKHGGPKMISEVNKQEVYIFRLPVCFNEQWITVCKIMTSPAKQFTAPQIIAIP